MGKGLRERVGRVDQANWKPAAGRDVLGTIKESNAGRLPKLIPMKMGLMAVSPFAFFRGTAPVMAKDLAALPTTGLTVQLCGDAHVKNLGAYAAPDGHLVFDINDFDETILGPWEWDLKRLAASIVLAGRDAGEMECGGAVLELVRLLPGVAGVILRDEGAGPGEVRDSRGIGKRGGPRGFAKGGTGDAATELEEADRAGEGGMAAIPRQSADAAACGGGDEGGGVRMR